MAGRLGSIPGQGTRSYVPHLRVGMPQLYPICHDWKKKIPCAIMKINDPMCCNEDLVQPNKYLKEIIITDCDSYRANKPKTETWAAAGRLRRKKGRVVSLNYAPCFSVEKSTWGTFVGSETGSHWWSRWWLERCREPFRTQAACHLQEGRSDIHSAACCKPRHACCVYTPSCLVTRDIW